MEQAEAEIETACVRHVKREEALKSPVYTLMWEGGPSALARGWHGRVFGRAIRRVKTINLPQKYLV